MKKILIISAIGGCLYISALGALYCLQTKMMYNPTTTKADIKKIEKIIPEIKEVEYYLPNGKKLYAWYKEPAEKKKLIIYFHGNSYNIEKFMKKMKRFIKNGYGILMPEYEGFGSISGNLTQKELENDTITAINWALESNHKESEIILYGHSLGTYLATYGAKYMNENKKPVFSLVLEAPFFSMVQMAKKRTYNLFPVSLVLKDKFLTHKIINDVNTRVLIAHGKQDKTIPYQQAQRLFDKIEKNKSFFLSETAHHNNLLEKGFFEWVLNEFE